MEDSRIIDLYLARDEEAIAETRQAYGSRLRALALGVTGDGRTAEECENDTYLEAWRSIPPHEPRGYFYPFLARIARHISLDRCRERGRLKRAAPITQLTAELEECIPAPDDTACRLEAQELAEAVNRFLSGLDREKRIVFLRRYWFLDPISAIARRLGCSEGKVKTTLCRVREKLRRYLEQEGYEL